MLDIEREKTVQQNSDHSNVEENHKSHSENELVGNQSPSEGKYEDTTVSANENTPRNQNEQEQERYP